jgi:hypothetical protein
VQYAVGSLLGTDLITEDVPISPLTVPLGPRQAGRQRRPVDDAPASDQRAPRLRVANVQESFRGLA